MESVQTDTVGASMAPQITTFDRLMALHAGEYTHAIVLELLAAEKERCAKVAEGHWGPESNTLSPEYILRHKIAFAIRSGK